MALGWNRFELARNRFAVDNSSWDEKTFQGIFTIGEAAWSTSGVSGKDEGGREGHFKKIILHNNNFNDFSINRFSINRFSINRFSINRFSINRFFD